MNTPALDSTYANLSKKIAAEQRSLYFAGILGKLKPSDLAGTLLKIMHLSPNELEMLRAHLMDSNFSIEEVLVLRKLLLVESLGTHSDYSELLLGKKWPEIADLLFFVNNLRDVLNIDFIEIVFERISSYAEGKILEI